MGLIRTALIFGAGYAVGDPATRRQLVDKANELAKRPEVQGLRERGREAVTARVSSGGSQDTGPEGAEGSEGTGARRSRWRTLQGRRSAGTGAVRDPGTAPDGGSAEFLESRNPVEKLSPGTSADTPATDAGLIPTDPAPSKGRPTT